MPARRHTPSPLLVAVLLLAVTAGGCSLLGIRQTVDRPAAEGLLTTAVDLARSDRLDQLCTLSVGEASTCTETLEDIAPLVPEDPPTVRCAVAVGDQGPLRGGMVLVLEGSDGNGDPYTTEFVVFDDGEGIGVLDAVWWSGLSIQGYDEETVSWRFDSGSTLCQDLVLPGQV